jgi:hypothetical protein
MELDRRVIDRYSFNLAFIARSIWNNYFLQKIQQAKTKTSIKNYGLRTFEA